MPWFGNIRILLCGHNALQDAHFHLDRAEQKTMQKQIFIMRGCQKLLEPSDSYLLVQIFSFASSLFLSRILHVRINCEHGSGFCVRMCVAQWQTPSKWCFMCEFVLWTHLTFWLSLNDFIFLRLFRSVKHTHNHTAVYVCVDGHCTVYLSCSHIHTHIRRYWYFLAPSTSLFLPFVLTLTRSSSTRTHACVRA